MSWREPGERREEQPKESKALTGLSADSLLYFVAGGWARSFGTMPVMTDLAEDSVMAQLSSQYREKSWKHNGQSSAKAPAERGRVKAQRANGNG